MTQKYQTENATYKQLKTGVKLCPIASKHDGFFMPVLLSSRQHELLSAHQTHHTDYLPVILSTIRLIRLVSQCLCSTLTLLNNDVKTQEYNSNTTKRSHKVLPLITQDMWHTSTMPALESKISEFQASKNYIETLPPYPLPPKKGDRRERKRASRYAPACHLGLPNNLGAPSLHWHIFSLPPKMTFFFSPS